MFVQFQSFFPATNDEMTVCLLLETSYSVFQKFMLLYFFWCSTPFTVLFLFGKRFKKPATAVAVCWLALGSVFLIYKDYEKPDVLGMHKRLGAGAQKLLANKWRKLETASLLFPVLQNVAPLFFELFLKSRSGCTLSFPRFAIIRKR